MRSATICDGDMVSCSRDGGSVDGGPASMSVVVVVSAFSDMTGMISLSVALSASSLVTGPVASVAMISGSLALIAVSSAGSACSVVVVLVVTRSGRVRSGKGFLVAENTDLGLTTVRSVVEEALASGSVAVS